ncbi:hypothetical protein QEV83_07510 [Methylocapsa sp. D3K7]|uniref:hypothetical protein n=1 Tax=Methylocapsa sp. D3K7 TaxID=3041435 RepID=UPI00244ECE50|nr:hypothetical protein [Methylocapsa sp. D3K7]WGJ16080.1 hypothetical protein QEV83_07510 [Methylocapsa sp. D3K7]
MTKLNIKLGIWLVLIGALAGCADRTSYSVPLSVADQYGAQYPDKIAGWIDYALPRGKFLLNVSCCGKDEKTYSVVISSVDFYADDDARFRLFTFANEFSDDHFTLKTDSGLLTSVSSQNKDRTPDIIVKAVQVAEAAAFGIPPTGAALVDVPPPTPFTITLLIDPFDKQSVNRALEKLKKITSRKIDLTITRANGSRLPYEHRDEIIIAANNCNSSLCFRLVVPIIVSFGIENSFTQFLLTIPDPILVGQYDIVRGPCIERTTNITLVKGVVTSYDLNKPSEVLGCLQIPLDVGKAILSVPGSLLTIKTERLKDEGAYLDAQTALLTAQANLLAAQAKVAGAKAQ